MQKVERIEVLGGKKTCSETAENSHITRDKVSYAHDRRCILERFAQLML